MAAPSTTPWDLYALLTPAAFQKSFLSTGLVVRNNTSGRLLVFKYVNNAFFVSKFNSPTSFNSDYAGLGINSFPGNWGLWMRIGRDTSSVLYFHVSADGVTWQLLFSVPISDFLGSADQIGFFVDAENSATPNLAASTTLMHWQTNP